MRKNALKKKTLLGYMKSYRFHGTPRYILNYDSIHSKLIIFQQPVFIIDQVGLNESLDIVLSCGIQMFNKLICIFMNIH